MFQREKRGRHDFWDPRAWPGEVPTPVHGRPELGFSYKQLERVRARPIFRAGFRLTHYAVPINEQYSWIDLVFEGNLENVGFPTYLGTPEGRIIMFDPTLVFQFPEGCVLQGSSVSAIPGRPSIPVCH